MIGVGEIGLPPWRVLRWVLVAVAVWVAVLVAAYIGENHDISLNPPGLSHNPTTVKMVPLKATSFGADGLFVDDKQVARRVPGGEWIPFDRSVTFDGGLIYYRTPR